MAACDARRSSDRPRCRDSMTQVHVRCRKPRCSARPVPKPKQYATCIRPTPKKGWTRNALETRLVPALNERRRADHLCALRLGVCHLLGRLGKSLCLCNSFGFTLWQMRDHTTMPITLDPSAAAVIKAFRDAGRPPLDTLSPVDARAASALGRPIVQPDPREMKRVEDLHAPAPHGKIPLRLYVPNS